VGRKDRNSKVDFSGRFAASRFGRLDATLLGVQVREVAERLRQGKSDPHAPGDSHRFPEVGFGLVWLTRQPERASQVDEVVGHRPLLTEAPGDGEALPEQADPGQLSGKSS
jgi:hypothetical protein